VAAPEREALHYSMAGMILMFQIGSASSPRDIRRKK
jgi:hypothetical protein